VRGVVLATALLGAASLLAAAYRASSYGSGALVPWLLASAAWSGAVLLVAERARRGRCASERRLGAQYRIASVLSTAVTVHDAAPRIMQTVCESLGWDVGTLWRVDADADRLRLIDMWARGGVDADDFASDSATAAFRRGEGMLGRCWQSAKGAWVSELEHEPLKRRELLLGSGFRSAFCFPVTSAGEVIGVMEFLSCERRRFDADLLDAVAAVGGQIGQFIRRRDAEAHTAQLEDERRRLLAEMLHTEAHERARIATALHDDTIQVLTAALVGLDLVARTFKNRQTERAIDKIADARASIAIALERARTLMFELRPPLLEAHGIAPAVTDAAEQAAEEAGFTPIVDVRLGRYPDHVEELVYRTVQEAITNVKKHAHASTLQIHLDERPGAIHGSIEDDGRGFNLEYALDRSRMRLHLGLDALAERVRIVGGDLDIRSTPGRGTRIDFHTPI
jgi:signal transduction histidine kinase